MNKIPEKKCNCQCWQCRIYNHEGCESDISLCNVEWVRLIENFYEKDKK